MWCQVAEVGAGIVEVVKALLPGLPAAIVALVVAMVGWRIAQHQTAIAQAKLKLDLFEKRFPIFQQTWEIMSEVAREGTRTKNWGLGTPFNNFAPQAAFLFGREIEAYLSEAATNWIDLNTIEAENEDPAARARNAARRRELKQWFHNEASTGLKERFGRYLDFERWR